MADLNNGEENKPRRRPKKKKAHAGHHGGAWKVAFADFMTALMALFLVLWLVSQADTKLKEAIANYFRPPGVFDTMRGGILSQAKSVSKEPSNLTSKDDEQALFGVAEALNKKFSSKPEFSKFKDQIKIEITEEGLKIQLIDKAERVSFPSGSAELTPEAEMILTEIAKALCELPNHINIGGHTDSYPFSSRGGEYTNWELSADRANAARRVLESVCIEPEQIKRIIGYADTEPLVANDPYAPANRRISITVLRRMEMIEIAPTDEENSDAKEKKTVPAKNSSEKNKTVAPTPQGLVSPDNEEDDEENVPQVKTKPQTDGTTESQINKNKLLKEGKVTIGESDKVPDKPKIKE